MIKAFTATAIILIFASSTALAQHRAGDAALGAVSGAIVLGPVGAVAGAFIGYSAGPSIARSWGLDGSRSSRQRTQASRDGVRSARAEQTDAGGFRPAENARAATSRSEANGSAPPPAARAKKPPPVQTLE